MTTAFVFGTKAETLQRVQPLLTEALVPEFVYFDRATWSASASGCLAAIGGLAGGRLLAVRSSATCEDGGRNSQAGAFTTVLGVEAGDGPALTRAIGEVLASMPGAAGDQVLVQAMVGDVAASGVITTHDLDRGTPYYTIAYDDESGSTDNVTGGRGIHKSVLVYREAPAAHLRSPRVRRFLALARELERLCRTRALDIEFALDRGGRLFLLQVRRIVQAASWHPVVERRVARQLVFIERFIGERGAPRPGVVGRRSILGVMPDWNPAEIIGSTPRPLAASLYRQLVTRSNWAEARAGMGYRPLPGEELMLLLNGQPYIDVRNSFNSLLPAGLPDALAGTLVDAWLDRLDAHPELHDKVEFEVAQTCLDFSFDEDFRQRYGGALPAPALTQFRERLHALTHEALAAGSLAPAEKTVAAIAAAQASEIPWPQSPQPLAEAARRIERCRRLGVPAFAVLARHAFIAEALLRSAVRRGALTEDRLALWRRSLRTVTSDLLRDHAAADPAAFLRRYGHLRPGTYDITSLRYDEREDLFGPLPETAAAPPPAAFALAAGEARGLAALLAEAGLADLDAAGLLRYAEAAASGREFAKFVFSRDLSDALALLVGWGNAAGLSRDDLSFLAWETIADTLTSPLLDDADRHFLAVADAGRRAAETAAAFRLPHLIRRVGDIYVATENRSVPNFVGNSRVAGKVVELDTHSPACGLAPGCIVCTTNADPGFDWIFTRRPAALITCFGGANSHMAIRCAELGLPAAIGCGEQLYRRIVTAGAAELDCGQRILSPLHGR